MFSQVFLAVTGQEMAAFRPAQTAYMACHFSAGGVGLSNMPRALPEGSILLLDDSMPVQGHDPEVVTRQLNALVKAFSVRAVLLDFQREKTEEMDNMAAAILQSCTCTAGVTEQYAAGLHCPVFLPPPPVNKPLKEHLRPWLKRGVFLEIAPEALQITVTKDGSKAISLPPVTFLPLEDNRLHCHYNVEVFPEKAVFTLSRTREDLDALAREAHELDVLGTVGLYQELYRL